MEALEAGKHLLLEKPVSLTAEEVAELHRLSLKKNLSVAVDFEYRAVPLFMQAKKILSEGEVGTPWLVKLDWLMSSRADQSRPWNWYSEANLGGGVTGALGTHAFDMLHWLIGPTASISALLSTSIKERQDPKSGINREVNSDDVSLAQLQLIRENDGSLVPAHVSLSAVTRHGRGCWLEVYGNNGTLILGSENQKDYVHGFGLWFAKKGEPIHSISPDQKFNFSKTWADGRIAPVARIQDWWAESINSGSPMVPGLTEGWASQNVCDKLQFSAQTGEKISFSGDI